MKALLLAVLLGGPAAFAAEPAAAPAKSSPAPKAVELPGTDAELKTADGWTIRGKHQAAQPEKLTVLLLHGRGQKKEVWLRLCRALIKEGYGYLAIDLRGHGGSQTAPDGQPFPWRKFKATKAQNDFINMQHDIQAGVTWLGEQGLAEEQIGIIGDALGGSVGLKHAAVHPKTPLLVMLSPGLAYQDIPIVNAIRAYKDRPILMIYGELDKTAAASVPVLNAFAQRSAGERKTTVIMAPKTHGVKLLTSGLAAQIVAWITDPIKPENAPAISTPTAPGESPDGAAAPDEDKDG
jgi:dienelactone hydrolase